MVTTELEGDKVNGVYDPTHTYYGIFQSNVYYTYDAANKYWVARGNATRDCL